MYRNQKSAKSAAIVKSPPRLCFEFITSLLMIFADKHTSEPELPNIFLNTLVHVALILQPGSSNIIAEMVAGFKV